MRLKALPITILGAVLGCVLYALPAHAQATRTWVSGVGDDANPCSRTAPCKTFAGAISKTATGGEINCLDPGGFGGLTITKSITVSCEAGTAGVLVSGTNGFIVNAPATSVVFLKGLDFEGLGTGLNGINFLAGGALHVEDCVIRNFGGANAFGIKFTPANAATFVITRTTLYNNGNGAGGGGMQVRPTSGFTNGVLDRVVMNRNTNGLSVDGFGGTSGLNITVRESTLNGNNSNNGILVTSTVEARVQVQSSAIINSGTGLSAANAGAVIRIGSSTITGNGTVSSGNVLSYVNNQINGNGVDTVPAPVPGGLH